MLKKNGDVESYTEASSPTPPGQENVTPTDMIDDAVREMVDNLEAAFGGHPPDEAEEK